MGGNIKQIETDLLGKEFSTKNCGKCSIDNNVYETLLNYEVDIND